jgi:hypothetical protein
MAVITISNTGGLWNATGTWVGGVVPTAIDDVVAVATSGNLTVNVASTCKSIDFTNYVATFTMSAGLTVKGNVKFVNTMTFNAASSVGLTLDTTATITSSGLTIPCGLYFAGTNPTITLADNWTVSVPAGTTAISIGSSSTLTLNANQISSNGNILIGAGGISGTTSFVMTGTSTLSGNGIFRNNLTFNAPGQTITVGASGALNFNYRTGILTYTAGTVQMFSSSVILQIGASTTLNTTGITWSNATLSGVATITLTSDLAISGALVVQTNAVTINGAGRNVNVGGNLTMNNNSSGTASITMSGTGTWSSTGWAFTNNFIINTAGTVTISGVVYYNTGTFTYTAGTVVTTGSTLNLNNSSTINTNGINWVNVSATGTQTMTSNLNISGTLTTNDTTTFTSSGGALLNLTGNLSLVSTDISSHTVTLPNALTIVNLSTNIGGNLNKVISLNNFSVNITGNLTYVGSNYSYALSGTTVLNMTGTGTISCSSLGNGGTIRSVLNINTTGTITIGTNFVFGGTFTYTQGTLITTGANIRINAPATFNSIGDIYWDSNFSTGFYVSTITLNSNLNCKDFLFGGGSTLSGPGILYTNNLTTNNTVSGGSNVFITLNTDIHVYNTFTMGSVSTLGIGGSTIFCYGDVNLANPQSTAGTTTIRIVGSGTLSTVAAFRQYPLVFDTPGRVVLSGIFYWNYATSAQASVPITYLRGNIVAKDATLYVGNLDSTLINMHKIAWKNVILTSGNTYTMNEFFSGTPSLAIPITPSSTTNYTVNFTNGFEKIAKFVKPSNMTLGTNSRLLITTDKAIGINSRTNTGNIRYINQHPNGVAKNGSLLTPSMTYDTGGLLPDPAFNKS